MEGKKRFLWTRSCRHADRNMSVGKPAGLSSKAPLRTLSQKIHHFYYYAFIYLSCVVFIYFMYLCFIFFFKSFPMKTLQIQGMIQFKFYNPDKLHAFRNIKFVTPLFILDCRVSPEFWPVSGVLKHFLTVLIVEHVLFDCTYDLWLI